MIRWFSIILIMAAQTAAADDDYLTCIAYLKESSKEAHNLPVCLDSAHTGKADIQYAVGMSFGYAGFIEKELAYYQLAANNGFIPAYLAVGHVLRSAPYHNEEMAIQWYKKFAETKHSGYGYAAKLISQLYAKSGNDEDSDYWLRVCNESAYTGC